jgi:ATP-dependent DNA helicase RecG
METFAKNKVEFSQDKFNILGVRNHTQQLYTNLGWLLSDQCTHSVKVAVFADEQNTIFRDRKEFTGSVLSQLEETFDYLQLCNKNHSVIDGLVRKDYWDYPIDAVREALLNALIHRDYGFSGSVIINVNDKQMEFISIGGLLPGISTEDIRNGISQLRNENFAKVFQRLNLIESYGTGIRRIFTLYENCPVPVTIDVTPNSFKITLPNMNAAKESSASQVKNLVTPQMQILLDYLKEHESISDEEVQSLLDVKRTRAFNLIKQMSEFGWVSIIGRGKNRKIVLNKID